MIQLTRVRTKQAIPSGFRGQKRVERIQELIAEFQAGEFNFKSSVWKAAKKQLKKESAGKCAYCEAPTSVVAHGDVEHFRPKSVYWWLAYCMENYTYSCQICNQSFKGDKFPVAAARMKSGDLNNPAMLTPDPVNEVEGMSYSDFSAACKAEKAHLPDVYRENPETYFRWEADPVKKEVKLAPRTQSSLNKRTAEACEDVLGLNRPELRGLRWAVFKDLNTFRAALMELPPNSNAARMVRDQIKAMMEVKGEFAGMVRYFVHDKWEMEL